KLEATVASDEEKGWFETIAARRKVYIDIRKAVFAQIEQADPEVPTAIEKRLLPAVNEYIDAISGYQKYQRELAEASNVETEQRAESAQVRRVIVVGACLLMGAAGAFVIARSVILPLRVAASATRVIADGVLSRDITGDGRDEVSELLESLNGMQASLRSIVGDVRVATDSITVASGQVAAGSLDLSSRTEETAASLQQAAASMEEISGTVRQTADSARMANQ